MNPFEKIFNYQIFSRLGEAGSIAVTAHERSWLKAMLRHPAAQAAFTPDTLEKLQRLLQGESALELDNVLRERGKSAEKHVYHPLIRPLRRMVLHKTGIRLAFLTKHGEQRAGQSGIPFKLEYSMVKREWYLLWHNLRRHAFMATKLESILSVEEMPVSAKLFDRIAASVRQTLEGRRERAVIELLPAYNAELSRIMYAFSCFEKEVAYEPEADVYRITLTYSGDESEYILSKIRFLGQRIRVVDNVKLMRRMRESAVKALARYGEEPDAIQKADNPLPLGG